MRKSCEKLCANKSSDYWRKGKHIACFKKEEVPRRHSSSNPTWLIYRPNSHSCLKSRPFEFEPIPAGEPIQFSTKRVRKVRDRYVPYGIAGGFCLLCSNRHLWSSRVPVLYFNDDVQCTILLPVWTNLECIAVRSLMVRYHQSQRRPGGRFPGAGSDSWAQRFRKSPTSLKASSEVFRL